MRHVFFQCGNTHTDTNNTHTHTHTQTVIVKHGLTEVLSCILITLLLRFKLLSWIITLLCYHLTAGIMHPWHCCSNTVSHNLITVTPFPVTLHEHCIQILYSKMLLTMTVAMMIVKQYIDSAVEW